MSDSLEKIVNDMENYSTIATPISRVLHRFALRIRSTLKEDRPKEQVKGGNMISDHLSRILGRAKSVEWKDDKQYILPGDLTFVPSDDPRAPILDFDRGMPLKEIVEKLWELAIETDAPPTSLAAANELIKRYRLEVEGLKERVSEAESREAAWRTQAHITKQND